MRGPLLTAVVVALAAAGPSAGATGIDSVYARPGAPAARPSGPEVLAALNPFLIGALALSLPRESVDRQDDSPGRPQVHFIYAVPSDAQDRGLDVDGILDGSIAASQTWLQSQT